MSRILTGFTCAPRAAKAAEDLLTAIEGALSPADDLVGGLVLATAAAGDQGFEVGERLAARWPGATFAGTSFEGLLAEGRVWVGQPAITLLAWTSGADAPQPILVEPEAISGDLEAIDHLEIALRGLGSGRERGFADAMLLFPDVLTGAALEPSLAGLVERLEGLRLVGSAAAGLGGEPALAWIDGEREPGAALGLALPRRSGRAGGALDLEQAIGSRFASPWLEVSRVRGVWIEEIEAEPALTWLRRQLGLEAGEPLEPWLDRFLIRLRVEDLREEAVEMLAHDESRVDYVERYPVGFDGRRGAIALSEPLRKGDRVAFALPDAELARTSLRAAVARLPDAPLLLQLACRARDARLHGDQDLESALVVAESGSPVVLGTVAPYQLAPQQGAAPRLQVHRTVLLAMGSTDR